MKKNKMDEIDFFSRIKDLPNVKFYGIEPVKDHNPELTGNSELTKFVIDENPEGFVKKLKELFSGKKGKQIAIMILALKKLDKIAYTYLSELLPAISEEFGDIGSRQAINDYITPYETGNKREGKAILTDKDLQPFITKIKNINQE